MKKITTLLMLAIATTLGWQANAQNGSDDCANAVAVTEGMITQTEINDANAGNNNGDSAWFVYTPAASGTIDVNSCNGGSDTRLFIWNDCADGAAVASNDDACPTGTGSNFASQIGEFAVVGGDDYFIQWDDRWALGPFDWSITFTPAPACPEPANVMVMANAFDAAISWDAVTEATNGYIVSVFDGGADPMVDTPVYTENVAVGTLMTTATGLMSETAYDAYVVADCDTNGLSLADAVSFQTLVSCPAPSNFTVDMITATDAVFTWDVVAEATIGYTLDVFDAGADPMVDTPVYTEMVAAGTTTATATGLTGDSGYDAYLVADCDTNGFSSASTLSFNTAFDAAACGGLFLDSGGSAGNYMPNELTTTTITPDVMGEAVTITFTYVDIESTAGTGVQDGCWDFLTIYDGPDTTFPVIAATLCGEESGDGGVPSVPSSLLSIGDSFTSSDPSGALTIVFDSDGSVQETGWVADVTCAVPPIGCDDIFYDSGGVDGNYMSGETTVTTIVPDNPGDVVTATFTYVDIETASGNGSQDGCWDFLTVYDGPDTTFPVLAMTLCGEESGDGGVPSVPESLLSIGDSFTSSDPSGALTFVFTSDGSVQETGWAADITCAPIVLPCPDVENFDVTNVMATTADLSWDAAPGAVGYNWGVFLAGADPDVDTPVAFELGTTSTSAVAAGLIPETSYDAYIRTICDMNESFGVGPVSFTTAELGVNDIDANAFVFAPNPTDGIVTIQSRIEVQTISIVNMLGQNVLTTAPNSDTFTLDLTGLSSGAYFMNATIDGVTITKKLIKE